MESLFARRAEKTFIELANTAQFESLIEASHTRPIVIFKHSRACGTSAEAYDELDDLLQHDDGVEVHLVDVLANRPLSRAIAERFAIRHESPQVLVLEGGQVRWHGSHYRVTADAVRRALTDR